jgi:MoxR-like ATPase
MEKIKIENVELVLSHPVKVTTGWIGQDEPLRQLSACWLIVAEGDLPLTPRIIGVPGIGKTTLAMAAAQARGQPVYIMQCTADTRPEDLLITPVLSEAGKISYHASPLLSAVIKGGIAVLDEGNRSRPQNWPDCRSKRRLRW